MKFNKGCLYFAITLIVLSACKTVHTDFVDYKLAFGSCTDPYKDSVQLWKEITASKPNLLLLEGDIIYTKKETIADLKESYRLQATHPDYKELIKTVPVEGIYDDHDYGMNDGGKHNPIKEEAKSLLMNFLKIDTTDIRYKRAGLYFSKPLTPKATLIVLDTRTFRDDLTVSTTAGKRYDPNPYGKGSMLGETQWQWLEENIQSSNASLFLLASTVQFLNNFQSYEGWGTMPHERDRMIGLLKKYPQKKIIFLSGDRHFSEITTEKFAGLPYALYDITSSGFTQLYSSSQPEPNPNRVSSFIREYNYCLLSIKKNKVQVDYYGTNNKRIYSYQINL